MLNKIDEYRKKYQIKRFSTIYCFSELLTTKIHRRLTNEGHWYLSDEDINNLSNQSLLLVFNYPIEWVVDDVIYSFTAIYRDSTNEKKGVIHAEVNVNASSFDVNKEEDLKFVPEKLFRCAYSIIKQNNKNIIEVEPVDQPKPINRLSKNNNSCTIKYVHLSTEKKKLRRVCSIIKNPGVIKNSDKYTPKEREVSEHVRKLPNGKEIIIQKHKRHYYINKNGQIIMLSE